MNVLVLTPALPGTSPGQRFRWEQWAPYLESEGVRLTFAPFEDEALNRVLYRPGRYARKAGLMLAALGRRLRLLAGARRYDLAVVYREASLVGPAVVERLLARKGVPIVYDFDDPIWIPYSSPTHGALARLKCPGKTRTLCRLARRVVVGNRLLAGWARGHARHVDVVPSTVDLRDYPPRPDDPRPVVTLGWTGSHSTLPFLLDLWGTLRRLAAAHPFRLVVVSHTDAPGLPPLPGAEIVARKWRAETEAADLRDVDIGLAPFPDAGWTPWRCHGKVLQYMAAGIPTVASRIGILPDYVRDGVGGFLAAGEDEWLGGLLRLMRDADLRRRAGRAARGTVERDYTADVWAPRVRAILAEALGEDAGRSRVAPPVPCPTSP